MRIDEGSFKACDGGGWVHRLRDSDEFLNNQYRPVKTEPTSKPKSKGYASTTEAARSLAAGLVRAGELDSERLPDHEYPYHDDNGRHIGSVLRWDIPNGKIIRPINRKPDGLWYVGQLPKPWTLYNLPAVLAADGIVWIAEGEKCVDAINSIGLVGTTSPHGAQSPESADWSPLAGKTVAILQDNDESGKKFGATVTKLLRALDPPATVKLVDLEGLPDKGDVYDWLEHRDAAEPEDLRNELQAKFDAAPEAGVEPPPWIMAGELIAKFTDLKPSLLWGLLRRGEVMNIIAASKSMKSWLVYALVLIVVTGRKLFGEFWATPCNVLLIDNELHKETIAHRLPQVAEALGIKPEEYADRIAVWSMRGDQTDVEALARKLAAIKPGQFWLIVLDAWYRLIPQGKDENSNADVVRLYNVLDDIAQRLETAIVVVHHSSKGSQGNKSVTDVGAGAGAQSRAADSHLTLRPHENDGVVVVDAALRSWPPIRPFCLKWEFPLWVPDPHSDPSLLKTDRPRKKRSEDTPPEPVWDAARFAGEILSESPTAKAALFDDASGAGIAERKASSLLKAAVAKGMAFQWPGDSYATIAPPDDLPEAKSGSKKQLVLNALAADPEADSQTIADRTGVTKRYVNTVRKETDTTAA